VTGLDLPPVVRSYLIGAAVGTAIGLVLIAAPFVPWRIAAGTGAVLAAVTAVFVRSLIDPDFLRPLRDVAPWTDQEWQAVRAADARQLRETAPERVRYRLRRPDETRDDIPAADLLVASRRAGVR
jgi:hypothetical protein